MKSYLHQVGSVNALLNGIYEGDTTLEDVLRYGDFGLGTINEINGELIIQDGDCYRANSSCELDLLPTNILTPLAVVTKFIPECTFEFSGSLAELESTLLSKFISKNIIYAYKVTGLFDCIKVRAGDKAVKPYDKLVKILPKLQKIRSFENISGSLVGFWFPGFFNHFNVPGFHSHFISTDNCFGGHLLSCDVNCATVSFQLIRGFSMEMIDSEDFNACNLEELDKQALDAVEKGR